MEEYEEIARNLSRRSIREICRGLKMPEEIWLLIDSMIKAGCRPGDVLSGLTDYCHRIEIRELTKDLPIELEED